MEASTERYYEAYLKYGLDKTIENNKAILGAGDEQLIKDFIEYRKALKGIGLSRQTKIGAVLVYWRRYIRKPYNKITNKDVIKGLASFRDAKSNKGEPFKQNHQREMIVILKSFLKWLVREKVINIDLLQITDIKTPSINTDTDRAENLFTADEINRMVAACSKSSHKALIYTIYETGCRPGEIARLRWKDIAVKPNSIQVTITDKKTKKERTAFVIAGKEYLLRHASDLPNMDLEDYIFKSADGKPLDPHTSYNIIYYAKNKAGIKKHLKLKLFRKSRVSNMMKEGYNDGAIREQIWGNQGTAMFKVYAKYSPADIERAMLIKAGIEPEEEVIESATKPRKCHVCGKSNEPDAKWCPGCGTPLIKSVAAEMQSVVKAIDEDPRFKEYQEKIKRLDDLEAQLAKVTAQLAGMKARE